MKSLRTPDDRFEGLTGYAFDPHSCEIDDLLGGRLRVHDVDEGPPDAAPVLLMHGEPSWCYLYRHKPTETSHYTFAHHVDWMSQLLFDRLDLRDITFFGQDWGGLAGLGLVARDPDRFARVMVGNTGLPDGERAPNEAGARIFPSLVPTGPCDPAAPDQRAAWEVLKTFDKPFRCAFSDQDAIGERQAHATVVGGGHFLQEDQGPQLARLLVDFIETTGSSS